MKPISYARHRFPPDVIRHAVWLYLRFTLSYRDVEGLLAERGLIVSNESGFQVMMKKQPAPCYGKPPSTLGDLLTALQSHFRCALRKQFPRPPNKSGHGLRATDWTGPTYSNSLTLED
jgi:hypothetical protein